MDKDYKKLYKEALERAKELRRQVNANETILVNSDLNTIFPELRESEDERIRKEILQLVSISGNGNQYEEIKDWLEKQGEKEPIEQDTEIRDLWKYIQEWREKFGRLPKDEDELSACIDYVMKRQKAAWSEKHIADVFEKVGLARIVREQGNDQLTNAVQSAMIELSKTAGGFVWKKI